MGEAKELEFELDSVESDELRVGCWVRFVRDRPGGLAVRILGSGSHDSKKMGMLPDASRSGPAPFQAHHPCRRRQFSSLIRPVYPVQESELRVNLCILHL
uniref:Uncharacterized protein n=1 Tax=Opuntia streptacantha TaxID=393608 RepID=A0A7C9A4C5_OPUST